MTFQKITPFLWFDKEAEDAAKLYTSIFKNSSIDKTTRYSEGAPQPAGSVMTVAFTLEGIKFTALNGGPYFKHSPAFSLVVHCNSQEEVDYFWNKFIDTGGAPSQCGWLTDKFGVSWQIVPDELIKLITDPDPARAKRAMKSMMTMSKIDLPILRAAADAK